MTGGLWLRMDTVALANALETPQDCDEVMKAAALRKSALLGETSAPVPLASLRDRKHYEDAAEAAEPRLPSGPAFRPDQLLGARHDTPDQTGPLTDWEVVEGVEPLHPACVITCHVCAALPGHRCVNTVTGEPGSFVHAGRAARWENLPQDAASAAEVAEGVERPDNSFHGDRMPCLDGNLGTCLATEGHTGDHMAYGLRLKDGTYEVCNSWPQEPTGHLPQHTGGHPDCTAPGCGQPGHHLHAASIAADGA